MRKLLIIIFLTGLFCIPYILNLSFAYTPYPVTGAELMEPKIVFETNMGSFEVKIFPQIAPKACENFIGLVKKGYYDDTIFHRIIPNFMIQGGDPTGSGGGGKSIWGREFEDEFSKDIKFDRKGLLAMANKGPATNGSQFFITVAPTPWLNNQHTIFGEVYYGYDTVEQIANSPRDKSDRPLEEIKIIRAYMAETEFDI